jgi:hypothetical protein
VRATRILYLLLLSVVACGGVTVTDKPTVGSEPSNSAGAGGALGTIPPDQIQVVDDVGHAGGQYPAVPPGSSSFFWWGGLGNWFVSSSDGSVDGDASIDDVIPPRGDSDKAYHVSKKNPGAAIDLWAQLDHPVGNGVDLSAYAGVSFWARLDSPSGELTVAFGANGEFSNVDSIAPVPQKVVSLSGSWTQYVVRFDEVGLNRTSVSSIDFVIGGRGDALGLWVNDLGFLCQGSCP